VRAEEQLYLAKLLREYREHVLSVIRDLERRQTPLTPLEARLFTHTATARLIEVEDLLRIDANRSSFSGLYWFLPRPARRFAARLRGLTRPRIGQLTHYSPRPLLVPTSYFATESPQPPPTISIVTPSYQQGHFLARTLQSVLSQGYPALEYVVQDGGSTDGTVEVLATFDRDLTSWVSEPDDGQADAINRGFSRTSGEIMAWLNSDDLLLPGALAYVAQYFASHPDVDVVYGDRRMIDAQDHEIGAWILPEHDDLTLTLVDFVPQETLFWRRSVWDAAGGRADTSFDYALDWDLLLRFRDAGARIAHLPRFIGAFRVHDEQKTSAQEVVGVVECDLLRHRVHGRYVPIEEIVAAIRPYMRRHVRVHMRERLFERVRRGRVSVLESIERVGDRPAV
jgi:glycosyltransferase involved in cell wall biosynthesis